MIMRGVQLFNKSLLLQQIILICKQFNKQNINKYRKNVLH